MPSRDLAVEFYGIGFPAYGPQLLIYKLTGFGFGQRAGAAGPERPVPAEVWMYFGGSSSGSPRLRNQRILSIFLGLLRSRQLVVPLYPDNKLLPCNRGKLFRYDIFFMDCFIPDFAQPVKGFCEQAVYNPPVQQGIYAVCLRNASCSAGGGMSARP